MKIASKKAPSSSDPEDIPISVVPPTQDSAPVAVRVPPMLPLPVIALGKETNPKDRAATSRLDLSLFPNSARAYGALAFTEGHMKYGGYNWRAAGIQVSVYVAALDRHMGKFWNGEWADDDTKVPHLASSLACIAAIIDAFEQGNVNDDRPPKQDHSRLLSEFENIVKHLQVKFPAGPKRYRERP